MLKENDLIEKREERNKLLNNVDVLEKVKDLLLLGDTELATTKQVADYYEVDYEVIKKVVQNNNEELISNGLTILKGKEIKNLVGEINSLTKFKGYFTIGDTKIANGKNTLFQKRTILNVGMLLRDSKIAKEVRRKLLDITQDILEGKEINKNIISNEIDEEKQIQLDIVQAMMDGDLEKESLLKTKLIGFQNKRIKSLEEEIDLIHTHSLNIINSRDVINRLMRIIACKEFDNFGKAYNELYKKLNYKLNINIKGRNKKKKQSYIDLLTEEETFKTEEIVRSWADKLGIDIKRELSLSNKDLD